MEYTLVKSRKGADKLADNGHLYVKDRQNADGTISWRCDQKHEGRRCKGRVKTNGVGIDIVTGHTCAVNPARIEVAVAVTTARERAVETHETARRIIAESTGPLSEEAKAMFPKYGTLQRQLARDRQRERMPYPTPRTLAEINIPPELRITKAEEPFLFHDSGADDPERFFIFATEANLETLRSHPNWAIDGTFKVAPEIFYQLWTIHAFVNNAALPLVYVLLVRKTEELYGRVLDVLTAGRQLEPQYIISDFEQAAINSFRDHFPAAEMHGCFFHLGQSVWKRVQSEGMSDRYKREEPFRIRVKMMAALAFVPLNEVVATFDELVDLYDDDDDLSTMFSYFEDNYIRHRNRRRPARFPVALWNCHEPTRVGLPRTNNNVEGWHRAFEGIVGCHHPSIYRLVEALQLEQSLMETRRAGLNRGEVVPLYAKKIYRQTNERLERLLQDFNNRDRFDFLRSCSHNFDF